MFGSFLQPMTNSIFKSLVPDKISATLWMDLIATGANILISSHPIKDLNELLVGSDLIATQIIIKNSPNSTASGSKSTSPSNAKTNELSFETASPWQVISHWSILNPIK